MNRKILGNPSSGQRLSKRLGLPQIDVGRWCQRNTARVMPPSKSPADASSNLAWSICYTSQLTVRVRFLRWRVNKLICAAKAQRPVSAQKMMFLRAQRGCVLDRGSMEIDMRWRARLVVGSRLVEACSANLESQNSRRMTLVLTGNPEVMCCPR